MDLDVGTCSYEEYTNLVATIENGSSPLSTERHLFMEHQSLRQQESACGNDYLGAVGFRGCHEAFCGID